MWWVGVNCTRHAGGLDDYLAHSLACSLFVEEEQLMPESASAVAAVRYAVGNSGRWTLWSTQLKM